MKWEPISKPGIPLDGRWVALSHRDGFLAIGRAEFFDPVFYDHGGIYIGDLSRDDFTHYIIMEGPTK